MSPVVGFHELGSRSPVAITGVSEEQFRSHISAWRASGAAFRTLKQWFNSSRQRSDILLSFDDAFALQLGIARRVLEAEAIPAVAFVLTGWVGRAAEWDYTGRRRRHADWPQLRAWIGAGFEVGSHGHSHRDLRRLSDSALAAELHRSREELEDRLSVEVTSIAYPFGRSDLRVRNAARQAGFQVGFGSCPAAGALDSLNLPRILISGLDSPLSVARRAAPGLWGAVERGKQRIVSYCSGGTPLWQQLRGDYP